MTRLWIWKYDNDFIIVIADTIRDARALAKMTVRSQYNHAVWEDVFDDIDCDTPMVGHDSIIVSGDTDV